MSTCKGNGECLSCCFCECSDCSNCKLCIIDCNCECHCDKDSCICLNDIIREKCTCGHREHKGMCKPAIPCQYNCEPKLCPNDKNHIDNEGKFYPEWLFECHGGNCVNCAIEFGHGFVHTDIIKECPVCFEDKTMVVLRCKHELCWDCWSKICKNKVDDSPETRASCPICRRKKW